MLFPMARFSVDGNFVSPIVIKSMTAPPAVNKRKTVEKTIIANGLNKRQSYVRQ
jgi:hypothetical protein